MAILQMNAYHQEKEILHHGKDDMELDVYEDMTNSLHKSNKPVDSTIVTMI